MHERKQLMYDLPDAFAALPGNHWLSRGWRTCCTRRVTEMAELARKRLLAMPGWSPLGIPDYPRAFVAGPPAFVAAGLGAG